MRRLQCSRHDWYLCRGMEFNGKCGSSTMLAELPESPPPRDTVANANWTWLWHLWKPLQSVTFGQERRVEGRCRPRVDLLQSSALTAPTSSHTRSVRWVVCWWLPKQPLLTTPGTTHECFLTWQLNKATKVTWFKLEKDHLNLFVIVNLLSKVWSNQDKEKYLFHIQKWYALEA